MARKAAILAVVLAGISACGGDGGAGPDPVEAVTIASPVEDVMAVGTSVQLEATARDASGEVVSGQVFTWHSADESVAAVDGTGTLEGIAAGRTTIRAESDGASGSFSMEVVNAELESISVLLGDPYTQLLIDALGEDPKASIRAAREDCEVALEAGHILDLADCLQEIRAESSPDPTDRAVLGVLSVIMARADALLCL